MAISHLLARRLSQTQFAQQTVQLVSRGYWTLSVGKAVQLTSVVTRYVVRGFEIPVALGNLTMTPCFILLKQGMGRNPLASASMEAF